MPPGDKEFESTSNVHLAAAGHHEAGGDAQKHHQREAEIHQPVPELRSTQQPGQVRHLSQSVSDPKLEVGIGGDRGQQKGNWQPEIEQAERGFRCGKPAGPSGTKKTARERNREANQQRNCERNRGGRLQQSRLATGTLAVMHAGHQHGVKENQRQLGCQNTASVSEQSHPIEVPVAREPLVQRGAAGWAGGFTRGSDVVNGQTNQHPPDDPQAPRSEPETSVEQRKREMAGGSSQEVPANALQQRRERAPAHRRPRKLSQQIRSPLLLSSGNDRDHHAAKRQQCAGPERSPAVKGMAVR